ncbi:MAG: hypothetical protein WCT39_03275, partial [Candidatus Margulisiibacteriota bacterium]
MKKTVAFLCLLALYLITVIGCGQVVTPSSGPIFTDPAVKIAELNSQAFTSKLFYEAIALEPRLNQAGTHASIGFWSIYANRARLMGLLNAINTHASTETYRAIWDEGTTTAAAQQYPSYITMNKEYWYERASPLSDGTVSIEGVHYIDPHPVASTEADIIWGKYSQRYVDM